MAVHLPARDQVDHAGEGVRSVETALRSAQHFDARDVAGQQRREIRLALIGAGDVDAIEQDKRMVGFGAANADLRERARCAGLADRDSGRQTQHIRHIRIALIRDQLAGKNRDGLADFIGFDGHGRTGDDNGVAFIRA